MLQSFIARLLSFLKRLIPVRPFTIGDILILLGALVLFAYMVYKSWSVGITTDEASTYMEFSKKGMFLYLTTDGSNHMLNTLFTFFTSVAFPYSELAIRFPNLLAGLLYILIAIRITKGRGWGPIAFGLLTASWFLIDYFCLSRGYGIASSLILLAAYAVWNVRAERNFDKRIIFSLYVLLAAAFANFSAVLVLIAIFSELFFSYFIKNYRRIFRNFYFDICILGAIGLAAFVGLMKLAGGGRLYAAYDMGFFESIWQGLFGFYYRFTDINIVFVLVSFFAYVIIIVAAHMKHSLKLRMSRVMLIFFIVWVGFHYGLNKPYPIDRTLLPILPVFALSIIELLRIGYTLLSKTSPYIRQAIAIIFFLGLAFNFYHQTDSEKYYMWEDDLKYKNMEYGLFHTSTEQIDRSERFFSTENPSKIFYQNKVGKSLYRKLKSSEASAVIDQDSLITSWYPREGVILVEMARASNYYFWEQQPYLLGVQSILNDSLDQPDTSFTNIMRFHKPISVAEYIAWIFYTDEEGIDSYSIARPFDGMWKASEPMNISIAE